MTSPIPSPPAQAPATLRLLVAGASAVVIVAGIKAVGGVLTPFLLALLIAQAVTPVMRILIRRGFSTGLVIGLTLMLVLVGGALVIALVSASTTELAARLPAYGRALLGFRDALIPALERVGINTEGLAHLEALDPTRALGPIAAIATGLLSGIGQGFFVLFLAALILAEFATLLRRFETMDRSRRTPLVRLAEMSEAVQKYIGITAGMALVGASLFYLVLRVLQVDFAATWAVLAFLFGFIPAIGGVLAVAPPALLTLLDQGWERMLILVAAHVLVGFVLGDIVKPKIMTKGFEISLVGVFLSLVVWHFILGPVGTILAVPMTVTLKRLYQEFAPDVQRAFTD